MSESSVYARVLHVRSVSMVESADRAAECHRCDRSSEREKDRLPSKARQRPLCVSSVERLLGAVELVRPAREERLERRAGPTDGLTSERTQVCVRDLDVLRLVGDDAA